MKKIIFLSISLIFLALFWAAPLATAQASSADISNVPKIVTKFFAVATPADCKTGNFLIFPTWYKYLDFEVIDGNCHIVMGEKVVDEKTGQLNSSFNMKALWLIAFAVIEILLTLAGIVAFAFVIIGGFKFVTAQGSPDAIVKARKTLANAIVGAILAVIAGRTVSFVATKLSGGVTSKTFGLLNVTDTSTTLATITNYALTVLGALSVITMIIAGIQFIVSSANPDKVKKARSAIYFALAGLAIAILASTIINFVIGKTT